MPRYLVTGGRQRMSRVLRREEWTSFECAVLLELDTDTGATRTVLEYTTPAAHCPVKDPSILFKSASWDGDSLLLCTQTEVLVVDRRGAIERVLSHPWFNDVHHVARIGGRLHVVSTGLDSVLVFDGDDVAEVHGLAGPPRFDRSVDHRRVPTTKPHAAHPNFVFEADGATWVTRFEQRDAVRLHGGEGVRVADDPIHDGLVVGGEMWFTVVSGQIVVADPTGVKRRYDLGHHAVPLGWCRGLHVERDRVLVGFSRLRPTLLKQNLAWLRAPLHRPPEPAPTRVVAYDLEANREVGAWHLEEAGINAIFSVLPA